MAKKSRRDYYAEINEELTRLELGKYAPRGISWVTSRISWCWKFRHITREQMGSLCDRAIQVLEGGYYYDW